MMEADEKFTRIDRMRYTKNTFSAGLAYLAILFDVVYFINIYASDINYEVGTYYYQMRMGISIVYNLLFMLATFLCSEGVKSYKRNYSFFLIFIGIIQVVRIFLLPLKATQADYAVGDVVTKVMGKGQFTLVSAYLLASGACCVISAVVGLIRCGELSSHEKALLKEQSNG